MDVRGLLLDKGLPFLLTSIVAVAAAVLLPPPMALGFTIPFVGVLIFVWMFVSPLWSVVLLLVSFYNPLVVYARLALSPWSYGVCYSLLGAGALSLALKARRPVPPWWRPVALAVGTMTLLLVLAAAHGLWVGNPSVQVASDFAQVFELYLALCLTAVALWNDGTAGEKLRVVFLVFSVSVAWEIAVYLSGGGGLTSLLVDTRALQDANLGSGGVLAGVSLGPFIFFPILVSVFLNARETLARSTRLLLGLALVLSTASVLVTFKRSIWASEILAVLVIFATGLFLSPLRVAARRILRGAAVGAVVLCALSFVRVDGGTLAEFVARRVEFTRKQLETGETQGIETRRFEYVVVGEEVADAPVFGRGLGREYVGYVRGTLGTKHFMHNTYLALLHRMGVVGLLFFAATLGLIVWPILRRLSSIPGPLEKAVTLGCLVSVGALCLQALVTGMLLTHPVSAYVGCLLGLALYLASGGRLEVVRPKGRREEGGEREASLLVVDDAAASPPLRADS